MGLGVRGYKNFSPSSRKFSDASDAPQNPTQLLHLEVLSSRVGDSSHRDPEITETPKDTAGFAELAGNRGRSWTFRECGVFSVQTQRAERKVG